MLLQVTLLSPPTPPPPGPAAPQAPPDTPPLLAPATGGYTLSARTYAHHVPVAPLVAVPTSVAAICALALASVGWLWCVPTPLNH